MSNIDTLGIDKLRFFTGNGYEIKMEKQYSVQWEIVPSEFTYSAFLKNPSGHLEMNPYTTETDEDNKIVNVVVDEPGLIKNYLTFTPYAYCDELYLYDLNNDIISTDLYKNTSLAGTPTYKEISLNDDNTYTFNNTYNVDDILFFSYRGTNVDDITTKQYSGIFEILTNKINLTKNVTYNSFICNITTENRIRIKHKGDVFIFVLNEDGDIQLEYLNSSSEVITETKEIYYDGIMYISYESTDVDFRLYRLEDLYVSNKLVITINNGEVSESTEFNLVDLLLTVHSSDDNIYSRYTVSNISTPNDDFLDETTHHEVAFGVKESVFILTALMKSGFIYDDDVLYVDKMSALYYLMSVNVNTNQYPYVRYIGSVLQDKVSTNLISSTTVIIVDDNGNENDVNRFTYPLIKDDDIDKEFQIHFKFQNNSEMFFVTSYDNVNLTREDSMFMTTQPRTRTVRLANGKEEERENAMHFTVGFETDVEGCYQNTMGMFIRDVETEVDYFLGLIIFNTEVVDEDERFRTLFTNFGIPDPINYPNIFKSQDYQEEGIDWQLINEKSKELFLSYDLIFPYVGTYKALFNAVKFLGYEDIVFKEWYKIKDDNDNYKYVAVQTFDTSTGTSLASVLKNYDVEFGQYERYAKLNRLSMIYHINELSNDSTEDALPIQLTKELTDDFIYEINHLDVPAQYSIYEYRNDEVLAKLYSVKKWLEHYITGVNCYISDINAEGVIIDRVKTVGYVTEHAFKDILNRGYFTPNTVYTDTSFADSSAIITCSLNEFDSWIWNYNNSTKEAHTGVTFKDYEDYSISLFIKQSYEVLIEDSSNITVYDSCPMGAITVADEYEFVLSINNADNGSLYEFASSDSSTNPILINDGEITFFDLTQSESVIEADEAPVILIRKGNIRKVTGSWSAENIANSNIAYSIAQSIDANGNSYYIMTNISTGNIIRCKANVTFSPTDTATLKYTANNIWNLPLFEMNNYVITNQMRNDVYSGNIKAKDFFNSNETYILEIIDGSMKFSNSHRINQKDCFGAELLFAENYREEGGGEQIINISYTYKSDRVPIYKCTYDFSNMTSFDSLKDCLSSLELSIETNVLVDIPVNRIGSYKVQVNAYDSYNNIFTNSDDDTCIITSKMPDIDIITNQDNADNVSDFYKYNNTPELLSKTDTSILLHSIDETIKFPINYKIYNAKHDLDNSEITYDNISYAIDTPKANDYLMLTNLTEQVKNLLVSDNYTVTITTGGNNLGKQNFLTGQRVTLCIYDDNLLEIIWKSEHMITITNMSPSVYSSLTECTITLSKSSSDVITDELVELVNNVKNNINMYIISTPYLNIPNDTTIINYYDASNNRRCFLPIFDHTNTGDFNKITYENNVITLDYSNLESNEINIALDDKVYILIYDYTNSKTLWLSNQLTVNYINNYTKNITFKTNKDIVIDDDVIDEANNNENVRIFIISDIEHIDESIDAFEENYSEDITLRHFPLDTMIKIRASLGSNTINETAYRIIDTSIYNYIDNSNPTNNVIKCGYILDGHIDLSFLDSLKNRNIYMNKSNKSRSTINNSSIWTYDYVNDIKYTMMPLHTKPVQYCLRVNEDASEIAYTYNTDFYLMETTVPYNSQQLLFDSYFDDSYSMSVFEYDPIAGKEIWDSSVLYELYDSDVNEYVSNNSMWADMYLYKNHPITIDLNRIVIIKTDEDMPLLEKGFKKIWHWKVKTIEDNSNWSARTHSFDNIMLFESINDKLCVKPYMLGSLSIELYCIDKYGNIISNTGGGNIYVK